MDLPHFSIAQFGYFRRFVSFFPSINVSMDSLLTLDHTTVFFHTLGLSRQTHTANVENWRLTLRNATEKGNRSKPRSLQSTSTVPGLTTGSTQSDVSSKRPHFSDVMNPTPRKSSKRPKVASPTPSKPTTKPTPTAIQLQIEGGDSEYEEEDGVGGLSSHDETQGEEMLLAKKSPIKPSSARTTSTVCTCIILGVHCTDISTVGPCRSQRQVGGQRATYSWQEATLKRQERELHEQRSSCRLPG